MEPGTQQSIHDEVRLLELILEPVRVHKAYVQVAQSLEVGLRIALVFVFGREDNYAGARPVELASHHKAVTAVVAATGDD